VLIRSEHQFFIKEANTLV